MTPEERDAFLARERTCRVATAGVAGPHLTALWFVWEGAALWLTSIVKSRRWTDIERDPRVSVLVDTGEGFGELRGVELRSVAEPVGDKYAGGSFGHDGRHAWLRVVPEKITSWDFSKMGLS